jgi:hypothetical protein
MTALNAAILFNSTSGSDTQSSGSSAGANVFGSGASTTSGSAVVTGITTTGVQAGDLLWVQSSSGRQFSVIASVDSGTQVTCDDTFANTESSRTWAIGGKRATIGSSDSRRLFTDWKAGWTVEMESGHSETLSSTLQLFGTSGSTTDGVKILKGSDNAATMPVLIFSNNGRALETKSHETHYYNFEIQNSNASKTASYAIYNGNWDRTAIENVIVSNAANNFWRAVYSDSKTIKFRRCKFGNTASHGCYFLSAYPAFDECIFESCGGTGIYGEGNTEVKRIADSIFSGNTDDGAFIRRGTTSTNTASITVNGNIFYNNGRDGLSLGDAGIGTNTRFAQFTNNVFAENGRYGIYSSMAESNWIYESARFDRNAFYNNTTAATYQVPSGANDITLTADPFVDSAAADFNIADNTAGSTLRANNFSINTDTAVYPFRQYVSDAFGAGGGGSQFHPLG